MNDVAPSEAELKDWMARFPPALRKFVEGVTVFNGKPYTIDLSGEKPAGARWILPLFYNKTIFAQAGVANPPTTFSELRQTAAKVTSAGAGKFFGITSGHGHPYQWDYDVLSSLAVMAGTTVTSWSTPNPKDGHFHWEDPAFITSFEVWINMRKDGSVFPGDMLMEDEQAKMTFATGKAALQFGGSWNIGNYYAYNGDVDFDLVLPPVPDTGKKGYYSTSDQGAATGYVVSASTKNPGAVWEVITFMSSQEFQEGWVQGGYGISFLPEANKPENFKNQPQMYKMAQWLADMSLFRVWPVPSLEAQKVYNYLPGTYPTDNDVLNNIYEGKAGYDTLKDLSKRRDATWDEGFAKAQAAGVKVSRADFTFPDWDPTKDYVQKK